MSNVNTAKKIANDFPAALKVWPYEVLYNNVLLPRTHEIDRDEESEAFDGSTESLGNPPYERKVI